MAYSLIIIILLISFTKGVFELLGIPETLLFLLIQGLVLLLFSFALFNILKNNKIVGVNFSVIITLFLFIFISYLVTDVSSIQFLLFLRQFGVYILFFYALFNLNITRLQIEKIVSLLFVLFLIQIPASLVKLIVLGGTFEKFIGTMSVMEGSLATTMPLIPIVYLINRYLEFKRIKDIILILLFIGIGLMSNKLGILFYVMALFIFMSILYARTKYFIPNLKLIKKLTATSLYILIIFSLFVTLNPRANPEHKVGGSIDIEYLQNFVEDYQTLDLKTGVEGDGRFEAPFVAVNRLYDGGVVNIIFGFGPGEIVKSSLTQYDDPLLEKYNIGYGGRVGVVWIMMQIGLVGLFLYVIFQLLILKKLYYIYKTRTLSTKDNMALLTVIGLSFIFFIDFFSYSGGMIYSPGIVLTYYFSMYYIFTKESINNEPGFNN